jgi:hypothetical protein
MQNTEFNPSQLRRLRFLESVACWEGFVARQRVSDAFQVTTNHITKDFAAYRNLYPDNLTYDISNRIYKAGPDFKPSISNGSPHEYLSLLRLYCESGDTDVIQGMPGPTAGDIIPTAVGVIDRDIFQLLTRAIKSGNGVKVAYQSMRTSHPQERVLWPHAFVHNGFRWHVRAFDSVHQAFGDYVLSRLLKAPGSRTSKRDIQLQKDKPTSAAAEKDTGWNEKVIVDVIPAKTLSTHQQDVIAKEYGMIKSTKGWVWSITLRRCVVNYFLQLHRLDLNETNARITLDDPSIIKEFDFSNS